MKDWMNYEMPADDRTDVLKEAYSLPNEIFRGFLVSIFFCKHLSFRLGNIESNKGAVEYSAGAKR